jgi:hypothetical protein
MVFHEISLHAEQRMRQRGIPQSAVDLVLTCGTPIDDGAYFLRRADVDREICRIKREIQSLEKLRNCKVVVSDGVLLTAYRPAGKGQKRTLRRLRDDD